MVDLTLEPFDHFSVAYDIISLVSEKSLSTPELALILRVSTTVVDKMISLMMKEGFLKTASSHSEFRLTSKAFSFLQEFAGIRRFVG